jgi:ubiquinone/menaquinone biosynthesis C-methylase UbiE
MSKRMNKANTWKEFWDQLATSRDPIAATDRPTVSPETYQLYSEEIAQKLALSQDDIVLDIGCGTGIIDAEIAAHTNQIVATDFCEVMAWRTRSNTATCGNVLVVASDCTALPFKCGVFSKVVVYAVAQYLDEAQIGLMLGEAQRVVRPGGLIMLGEIPRSRDVDILSRVRDVWAHQGARGILSKLLDRLYERWLWFLGRVNQRFVRPEGPPITLHSVEALLGLVHQRNMRGWVLPQRKELPWFHQTIDLLIENRPPAGAKESGVSARAK